MAKTQSQVTTLDDGDAAASADVATTPAFIASADAEMSGEKAVVTIHPVEGDGGSDAVFLQVNGYAYQIPRGKPVEIPVELLEVLKNARMTHYSQGAGGAVSERTVQRFAFSAGA